MAARRTRRSAVAGLLVLVPLVAACGGGPDDAEPPRPAGGGEFAGSDLVGPAPEGAVVPEQATTRTTDPPVTDLEGAYAVVEERVLEAQELVDALLQEPGAVDASDDPRLRRLREIYRDGSSLPEQLVASLRALVDQGQHMQPAASGFFRRLGVYDLTVLDDRTIGFYTCHVEDVQVVDAAGTVVDEYARVVQSKGVAERVDGVWLLVKMVPMEGFSRYLPPGFANPDVCDDAAAAAADQAAEMDRG